jgi:nucleoid DNA-binding protein
MAKTLDLINLIANQYNLEQRDSKQIIEKLFEYLIQSLSDKERIEIRNFGTLSVKSKKNNLNWVNKYSLCKQEHYNILNYKMSSTLQKKLFNIKI